MCLVLSLISVSLSLSFCKSFTVSWSVPINSSFFMFSDGITDQVGGPKNIMYGKKRILKIISETSDVKNSIQHITKDLESYQKSNKRRDDLSLFGFSIA